MSHECENFTDTGCRQCMKEMAAAIAAKPPPEEKPDDVVERCAKACWSAADQFAPAMWPTLTPERREKFIRGAKAVLQVAGVERLREELTHAISAAQFDSRRAEAAETALAEAKARIADLGHVVERAVAMRSQYLRRWTNSPSMLCDPSAPPASVQDFDDAMKALDAAQPKDSGEPGRTPSPGPHREDGYAELPGSSSLSRDVATIARILRQGYCGHDYIELTQLIERNER